MANVSNYYAILSAAQSAIIGLGLTFAQLGAQEVVPVLIRRLPLVDELLDALPLIVLCPSNRPEDVMPFTTEDQALVKYTAECVLIDKANRDFSDTNLDLWFSYGEQIRRLFQWGLTVVLPTGGNLFFAEILPDAPLDREQLNKSYNYSGFGFRFWVAEKRTN